MSADDEKACQLCYLPTELLLYIFTFLPAKDLIKCRQVCSRWKLIVDRLTRSDSLWRKYCKNDFNNVYKTARYKSKPGLLWFNVYRSLSLWPRLSLAHELSDEFASASNINDEIRNFRILRNGVIGVHKRGSIVYYDVETLRQSKRGSITGDYATYAENDHVIAIKSYHLNLYIVRKELLNPRSETNVTYDNVKSFILIDQEIYYVTLDDEIYVCNLEDLTRKFIKRTQDGVMSLGFTDRLHILTFQRDIYTVVNNDLVFNCTLGPSSNLLHQLQEYHFLEQLDWRVYFQWMYALNHTVPQGPLRDIVTVRSYGDIFFVGSNWGVLRIYHAPYSSGEFDLFNSEPVKQYNFMERRDCPVLSMCPILQIDVLEVEDGHTVMVAMPKKIAVLNFAHSFKRTASVAMLPYDDVQKVKFLKIDEACDSVARIGVEKVKCVEKKLVDVLPRNIERTQSQLKENGPSNQLTKMEKIKKIKESYTFRNKYSRNGDWVKNNAEKCDSDAKNDRTSKKSNEETRPPANERSLATAPSTDNSVKTERRRITSKTTIAQQVIRRPIIKTVTSKNEKVYKAVNFVERKAKPTQLQINIPTDFKPKDNKVKAATSKISVKEKRKKIKRIVKPAAVSPDVTVKIRSPPTEVAKWSNVDSHRKLYYEAWVDTTLTAISKKANNKFDKKKLMQTFQKALAERSVSPDVDYSVLLDEKYTGKIRVNKR